MEVTISFNSTFVNIIRSDMYRSRQDFSLNQITAQWIETDITELVSVYVKDMGRACSHTHNQSISFYLYLLLVCS